MAKIQWDTGVYVEVNALKHLKIVPETDATTNPDNIWCVRVFAENDTWQITWVTEITSTENDLDYRQRVSQDLQLDEEVFNYTAQNTWKHSFVNTTMTAAWEAGQFKTNSGNIITTTTGLLFQTRAMFPTTGTCTLSGDCEFWFTAFPTTNSIVNVWFFQSPAANPYAPTDWVYLELTSGGLQGIINHSGTITSTGIFPTSKTDPTPWAYVLNKKYQFIIYSGTIEAKFWVNDGSGAVLLGSLPLPAGQARLSMSGSLPFAIRHVITGGAAGAVLQCVVGAYNIRLGGVNYATSPWIAGNRMYGSYQGLSGGTMGGLSKYTNNTNATAGVATNTTAALGTGYGWEFWETDTLAVNTDGIIMSQQIPAWTVNYSGKRMALRGVKVDTYVQTALTGGWYNEVWSINFWHTAVSLATTEGASTKIRRVVPLGVRTVASGAVALTLLPTMSLDLWDAPIFINPWEFIAISKKKVWVAPSAGVMAHTITLIYGWE